MSSRVVRSGTCASQKEVCVSASCSDQRSSATGGDGVSSAIDSDGAVSVSAVSAAACMLPAADDAPSSPRSWSSAPPSTTSSAISSTGTSSPTPRDVYAGRQHSPSHAVKDSTIGSSSMPSSAPTLCTTAETRSRRAFHQ
eukprot:6173909-Pleurochrysis_carterae.AAC.1